MAEPIASQPAVRHPARTATDSNAGALTGFLMVCFVVVGLTGLFSIYATPIALQRILARETVLDQVLADADQPDRLAALRPQLDDSADAVLNGTAPLAERVATERVVMRARLTADFEATRTRLLWLQCVITLCAGCFGAAMLGFGRKRG